MPFAHPNHPIDLGEFTDGALLRPIAKQIPPRARFPLFWDACNHA